MQRIMHWPQNASPRSPPPHQLAPQVSRGEGDDSDADDDDGGDYNMPAILKRSDVASLLLDVTARTNAARATGKVMMEFPGGLKIAVKVDGRGGWRGGGGHARGVHFVISRYAAWCVVWPCVCRCGPTRASVRSGPVHAAVQAHTLVCGCCLGCVPTL